MVYVLYLLLLFYNIMVFVLLSEVICHQIIIQLEFIHILLRFKWFKNTDGPNLAVSSQ